MLEEKYYILIKVLIKVAVNRRISSIACTSHEKSFRKDNFRNSNLRSLGL